MQAHGSDRVRRGHGEQWVLFCPRPKGWVARTPKTLTASERPGSAVLWSEQYFEVISAEPSGTGVRYVLEPWHDEHIMRTVDAYDGASEARREEEHRSDVRRTTGRRAANLFGIFTGHLPAAVQERLASELGILATRLTALSLIVPFVAIAFIVNEWVERKMGQGAPLPLGFMLLAGYLGLETAMRLNIVWTQSRPVGSAAGFILYAVYYALSPNRKSLPRLVEPPRRRAEIAVAEDVAIRDAFTLREPLLTLLTPAEQRLAADRFGYDYRRTAPMVAAVILLFSILGFVTSWSTLQNGGGISPLVSLIVAGTLGLEQIVRLSLFRRGPAGSILAVVVRPLASRVSE
ncbi:MAG TPA: hypothetical protein VM779_02170 [Thermoanaerobaculia bacterium]|nr:hypothetical protein [Thermoanaerobaculia bacterium]